MYASQTFSFVGKITEISTLEDYGELPITVCFEIWQLFSKELKVKKDKRYVITITEVAE